MKNPWILPTVTLLVGAAGGFISGKNTGSAKNGADSENASPRTRVGGREASAAEVAGKLAKRITGTADISRMPGNSTRIQALMEFYSGLTPGQLAEEAGKLESLPMNERIMASFLLFGRWAEVDASAAMSFSNTMGFTGMFVRPTILQSWASVDPENAAKYYGENPREFAMMGMMGGRGRGPMSGQGGASIIASEWARQDAEGALEWANTLTTEKGQALGAVVGEVAKTDPRKAAEMLGSMSGDDLGDSYRSVAARYGALDFDEAQTWIRTLPADDQASALASAIGGLSNNDPAAAAAQLALMEDGDAKNRVVSDVVEDWARIDTKAAGEFLKQQTDEGALRDGMRELMPTWVGQDPQAALAYAYSYEAGDVRDSALQTYVWSNNTGAPAELIKVAETITDEEDRNRAVSIAARRWMTEDAAAAKAYVDASSLSDEAKSSIINNESPWGGRGRGRGRD